MVYGEGGIKSLAENTSDGKRREKQLFLFRLYPEMVKSICAFCVTVFVGMLLDGNFSNRSAKGKRVKRRAK